MTIVPCFAYYASYFLLIFCYIFIVSYRLRENNIQLYPPPISPAAEKYNLEDIFRLCLKKIPIRQTALFFPSSAGWGLYQVLWILFFVTNINTGWKQPLQTQFQQPQSSVQYRPHYAHHS